MINRILSIPYPEKLKTLEEVSGYLQRLQGILVEDSYLRNLDINVDIRGADHWAFKTITGITADVVADKVADSLTLAAVGPLTIVGTAATDTITWTWAHLGLQSLADPGGDRIFFWDDSETASKWLACDGTTIQITGTTLSVIGAGLDHGTLLGLADDDHTQYSLVAGTRAFTGPVTFNSGYITINEKAPDEAAYLKIDGADEDVILFSRGGTQIWRIQTPAFETGRNTEMAWVDADGNEVMTLDQDGNLDVVGSLTFGELGDLTATWEVSQNIYILKETFGAYLLLRTAFAGATSGGYIYLDFSRGTKALPTVALNGDRTGSIWFRGYDGDEFLPCADIIANIDATPGDGDMPGRLVLRTTADGAAAPTERMRIDCAGLVRLGASGTLSEVLNIEGRIALKETTSPSDSAGYGKVFVKSSDSRLYFRDDGGTEYDLTAAGAGGAPLNAEYVVGAANATLSAEIVKAYMGDNIDPDAYPAAPNALDDEFEDGSLNVKWTAVNDPGLEETTYDGCLWTTGLTGIANANLLANLVILYQTPIAGTGTWTVAAKVAVSGDTAAAEYMGAAIGLFDTVPANDTMVGVAIQITTADTAGRMNIGGQMDSGAGALANMTTTLSSYFDQTSWVYIALEKSTANAYTSANTYIAWFSFNGIIWSRASSVSKTFANIPNRLGLYFRKPDSGSHTGWAIVDWFRRLA